MIKDPKLRLPGKKVDTLLEIILIDAAETPIERPKKREGVKMALGRGTTYRNRRRRFGIRFHLTAGIYNLEVGRNDGNFDKGTKSYP